LDQSEFHYLANKLFVDPYLLWLQEHVKDKDLNKLSASLMTALSSLEETATKKTLGLNLLELEKMIQDD
jgi:hypothetical protein